MISYNIINMLRGFKKIPKEFYEKKYNIKIELFKTHSTVVNECEYGFFSTTIYNNIPFTFNYQLYEREIRMFHNSLY